MGRIRKSSAYRQLASEWLLQLNWRAILRSYAPRFVRGLLARQFESGFRYKQNRESPTDYLAEFNHKSLQKAKASILWFDGWSAATAATARILNDLGLLGDGLSVVDYGCGIGRISRAILETSRAHVIAVDRSPEMLRHARQYIPSQYFSSRRVELLSDLQLIDRVSQLSCTIDSVILIEVLQHIPEPVLDEVLPALFALLVPNGRLFVFGNEALDVDREGRVPPESSGVEQVLNRHGRILRIDTWRAGFSAPRQSYLIAPPPRPLQALSDVG